jgi:hypothetical protein
MVKKRKTLVFQINCILPFHLEMQQFIISNAEVFISRDMVDNPSDILVTHATNELFKRGILITLEL